MAATEEQEQKHYELPLASKTETHGSIIKGHDLKVWMKKHNIWNIDLFEILVSEYQILNENDLKTNINKRNMTEIIKKTKLRKQETVKSHDALQRITVLLNRFEEEWYRITEIRKDNDDKKVSSFEPDFLTQKALINQNNMKKGQKLKKWMQSNNVWESYLFQELLKHGIIDADQLNTLKPNDWQNIKTIVRVHRFKNNNDNKSRSQCDKLLTRFEKMWKKALQN